MCLWQARARQGIHVRPYEGRSNQHLTILVNHYSSVPIVAIGMKIRSVRKSAIEIVYFPSFLLGFEPSVKHYKVAVGPRH